MKKLLPLITLLLLLSSCEFIREFFGEVEKDQPNMESICKTLDEDGLISFIFSVDPDITNVSEIDNIQYTFSYSNGGAENMNVDLSIDESFQRTDDTTYTSRNSFSRDIIIYPNEIINNDNDIEPFEVAEIMIDMPGGETKPVKIFKDLMFSDDNNETKDCCTTVSAALTNVVVTLKDKTQTSIRLPGCFRLFESGECCDIKLN